MVAVVLLLLPLLLLFLLLHVLLLVPVVLVLMIALVAVVAVIAHSQSCCCNFCYCVTMRRPQILAACMEHYAQRPCRHSTDEASKVPAEACRLRHILSAPEHLGPEIGSCGDPGTVFGVAMSRVHWGYNPEPCFLSLEVHCQIQDPETLKHGFQNYRQSISPDLMSMLGATSSASRGLILPAELQSWHPS